MRGRRALLAAGAAIALVAGGGTAAQAAPRPLPATHGCTNSATVPVGAATGPIADVDGDGKADTQFAGAGNGRYVFGIRTAAGGVYSIVDTLRGDGVHGVWTANLLGSGTVTVIDDGETARLYAFRDCAFVRPQHATGGAYDMKLGGGSTAGTGVACNDQNGGPILLRAAAVKRKNGRYDVRWTTLRVSDDGRTASRQGGAGSTDTRWSNLKASDPRVRDARGSFCRGIVGKVDASTE